MRGRNYTISERAIIVLGCRSKQSLQEINTLLGNIQKKEGRSIRHLNASSYKMMLDSYLKMSDQDLWKYIQKPQTLSNVK
jgi:hypothetical protein